VRERLPLGQGGRGRGRGGLAAAPGGRRQEGPRAGRGAGRWHCGGPTHLLRLLERRLGSLLRDRGLSLLRERRARTGERERARTGERDLLRPRTGDLARAGDLTGERDLERAGDLERDLERDRLRACAARGEEGRGFGVCVCGGGGWDS
jgi:hypothetical protein